MISREDLLKFVIIDLGFPPSELESFDDLTLSELLMLAEYKRQKEKEYWEMLKRAVMFGVAGVYKGKEIPMFEKPKTQKITKEQREAEIAYLKQKFGGLSI